MRVLIQRVSRASVTIDARVKASIGMGLLVFAGIEETDSTEDIEWISSKIVNFRIFNDVNGVMNLSLKDMKGELLLVSQFTLHASIKKGNRPSYNKAAKPEIAIPVYERLIVEIQKQLERPIQTGEFGADMKVELLNDGPVTLFVDSKNKE